MRRPFCGSCSSKGLVFVHLAQTRTAAIKVLSVFAPADKLTGGPENGLAGKQMQAGDRRLLAAVLGQHER